MNCKTIISELKSRKNPKNIAGNKNLRVQALKLAREIQTENPENKTAKWIATDAIRELKK